MANGNERFHSYYFLAKAFEETLVDTSTSAEEEVVAFAPHAPGLAFGFFQTALNIGPLAFTGRAG
jgi:hypothetical protein